MRSQTVSDVQLGQAVLESVRDGSYPDSEAVISAELPTSALPVIIDLLETARQDVKRDIQVLSREIAPDVDGWISQARQLRNDIDRSEAEAREIVKESENGRPLQGRHKDASSKVDFLKDEVYFSETLVATLQSLQRIQSTLDSVQEATFREDYPQSIELLEDGERQLSQSWASENTFAVELLSNRAVNLRKSLVQQVDQCWEELINVDKIRQSLCIVKEINRGSASINIETLTAALDKLGLLQSRIDSCHKSLDQSIISPLLAKDGKEGHATLTIRDNSVQVEKGGGDRGVSDKLEDLKSVFGFLNTHLPSSVSLALSETLMPSLSSRLIDTWLISSVPSSLRGLEEYEEVLKQVQLFVDFIRFLGWKGEEPLAEWASRAPRVWITKRREGALLTVRELLLKGAWDTKTVERVETQVFAPEFANAQGQNGGQDDWNAGWSDDDNEPNADHPSTAANGDEEEDVSAWGLDEPTDESRQEKGARKPAQEQGDDDIEDAWGWGEDDDGSEQSELPKLDELPHSAQVHQDKEKRPEKEITLKEAYTITTVPEAILEKIQSSVFDGNTLMQPSHSQSPVAPAAAGLFTLPTLILAMYRACAPSFYSSSPSGLMFAYNDSMWVTEQLRKLVQEQSEKFEASPTTTRKLTLDGEISLLESYAKRAYSGEMESQRRILGDMLDGAQGFANCTVQPFAGQCHTAVQSTVDLIRGIERQWKGILSRSALLQSIGSLLSTVISKFIVDIEDMSDISEPESQRLVSFCNEISKLEDLFLPEQPKSGATDVGEQEAVPLTAVYTPNWLKFQYLINILESSLVDIKYLWTEGELRLEFGPEEVIDLIEALFADSDHRRRAIGDVRRSSHGR
ncbi:centromere/kinetochore protein Zw10 [Xylona heveae TC161]|uniref:Centromere/kinetochore protein Zw10 n=1 Tax=Xylona heveae (strain CBS 132557 / TC161) TaxID=1328760 RepID=A0A165ID26_XYLHT|nr:centromere/kinetochore protein Zw10 [Xylona heveae TC161]KZF24728.1 centromere/kinetochore protein Zw10 [Xylona heveae TC161]